MNADAFLQRFEDVRGTGPGRWIAKCPAHEDRSPSVSLRLLEDGRWLIHDFAGCDTGAILSAVDLHFSDLYPEKLLSPHESGSFKRERQPFNPADVLRLVTREALVVSITASDIAKGATLTSAEVNRVVLAAERINDAVCVAGGVP